MPWRRRWVFSEPRSMSTFSETIELDTFVIGIDAVLPFPLLTFDYVFNFYSGTNPGIFALLSE